MTFAQQYAKQFVERLMLGIDPANVESLRVGTKELENFIAIAFLAGGKHALDVQIEMVNQSARDMYSQPRMQASELTRDEYIAKGKALEIDWSRQEAFQASKPAVFDRSVLDKLTRYQDDEYCGAIPDPSGEYVKLEDVLRLTEEK